MAKPIGAPNTVNGRVIREPAWPSGGMVSRPMDDRRFDVQRFTGFASATVARGQWDRGIMYRFGTTEMRLPREARMYDPTDPAGVKQHGRR